MKQIDLIFYSTSRSWYWIVTWQWSIRKFPVWII